MLSLIITIALIVVLVWIGEVLLSAAITIPMILFWIIKFIVKAGVWVGIILFVVWIVGQFIEAII